jgi:hypothetical protein
MTIIKRRRRSRGQKEGSQNLLLQLVENLREETGESFR